MPSIQVEKIASGRFRVRIIEGQSQSLHHVSLDTRDYERLCGGKLTPEELVKRSFEFLLEREPKDSILPEFDLRIISRYFPEYEHEIKSRA